MGWVLGLGLGVYCLLAAAAQSQYQCIVMVRIRYGLGLPWRSERPSKVGARPGRGRCRECRAATASPGCGGVAILVAAVCRV